MGRNLARLLAAFYLFAFPAVTLACDTWPVQLSLLSPAQIVPPEDSVSALSLGLLYTRNRDVSWVSYTIFINHATGDSKGLSIGFVDWTGGSTYGIQYGVGSFTADRFVGYQRGLVGAVTEGDFTGYQTGLFSWTEGFFHGWQDGLLTFTRERFVGLQTGLINLTEAAASGVDIGIINYAEGSFKGWQAGLINYAGEASGLQLGVVNIAGTLNGGVQIGLANYNGDKEPFEFLPVINWSF